MSDDKEAHGPAKVVEILGKFAVYINGCRMTDYDSRGEDEDIAKIHAARFNKALAPLVAKAQAADQLKEAGEYLWGVLANVSGGDWKRETKDWREGAAKARDGYFKALIAYRATLTPSGSGGVGK